MSILHKIGETVLPRKGDDHDEEKISFKWIQSNFVTFLCIQAFQSSPLDGSCKAKNFNILCFGFLSRQRFVVFLLLFGLLWYYH